MHGNIFAPDYDAENPKKKKKLTKGEYLKECLKLIVVFLHPLSLLDCPAFRALTGIHSDTFGLILNAHNIPKFISKCAEEIRNLIRREVDRKMVSIKLDIATKHHRSVLAINIQFYCKIRKRIVIRTIGSVELRKRHTASYLEQEVKKVLDRYSIDKLNLYTYTSDNGRNVISLGKILKSQQHFSKLSEQIMLVREKLLNQMFESDSEDEESDNEETDEIDQLLSNELSVMSILSCAAHTLQLAVMDTIKILQSNPALSRLRSVVKNLKLDKFKEKLNGVALPRIDCITRWNSLYTMLDSLKNFKEDYKKLIPRVPKEDLALISVSQEDWDFVDLFLEAFKPTYICTQRLQHEQLSLGKLIVVIHRLVSNIF
jgi:hypothetical protein